MFDIVETNNWFLFDKLSRKSQENLEKLLLVRKSLKFEVNQSFLILKLLCFH